jgi:hypothetical protein
MRSFTRVLRDRLVPAVLTAAGVTLLGAGLLQYGSSAQAGPVAVGPSPSLPDAAPSIVLPSLPPLETTVPGSASPDPTTAPDPNRVATRVVMERLGIDLPVIAQPNPRYPSCNVAMWFEHPELGQPGSGKAVYLYAHARTGMFLPLLNESKRNRGKAMVGMLVDVYTSDDQRYVYRVSAVLPRVPADSHFLDKAIAAKQETLWLQTSTGPGGQYPKLQVVARFVGAQPADPAFAHPRARPVDC